MKKQWMYQWILGAVCLLLGGVLIACVALENAAWRVPCFVLALLAILCAILFLICRVLLPLREMERLFGQEYDTPNVFFDTLAVSRHLQAQAMGQAVQDICKHLRESYLVDLDTKQAELSALQSQINPHFLYNTLDSIRGQALYQGAQDVADMTEALSSFFRYSVSQRSTVVPLAQELDNVHTYFKIQQFRFNNRFHMHVQVEHAEDLEQCYLPKLSIQPVVENAIVHGLEGKLGTGEITIAVESTAGIIQITISDDGVGMSADVLKAMQQRLQRENFAGGQGEKENALSGIGLGNVAHRIELLFGERYPIQVMSTRGIGTDVVLTLPRREVSTEHAT